MNHENRVPLSFPDEVYCYAIAVRIMVFYIRQGSIWTGCG